MNDGNDSGLPFVEAGGGLAERVTPVPAPWRLQGHAYGLLYRLPREVVAGDGLVPDELRSRFVGGTSALLVASYDSSDAGPYRELLFVPGRFRSGSRTYYSVTRSFVSSPASAASGRQNWGLPRDVAEITFEKVGPLERVVVRRGETTIAAFTFRTGRLGLPATTDVLPASTRTIMQATRGRDVLTTLGGRGTLKAARLVDAEVDTSLLPDLTLYQPVMAVRLEGFSLALPRPIVIESGGSLR